MAKEYDKTDKISVVRYAGELTGHSLLEVGALDISGDSDPSHTKGMFGQVLERAYFDIANNNLPVPDFETIGLELKSTPMKRIRDGMVSKERLMLGIIDYNTIGKLGFEDSFLKKNGDLLIVFYLHDKDANFSEYRILKVAEWKFPPNDLRIIKDDWNIINRMIEEGRAHELSERFTQIMGPAPKGSGKGKDLRKQPFSDILARQRAFALKNSYINKIYADTVVERFPGFFIPDDAERFGEYYILDGPSETDTEYGEDSIFHDEEWVSGTYEEFVVHRFERFVGRTFEEIEQMIGTCINPNGKDYFARVAVAMATGSSRTKHVKEFRDAGISMKTIRVDTKDRVRESMSFPALDYMEVANGIWEESEFHEWLDKRFLFIGIRQNDKNRKNSTFLGVFFWSIPQKDMDEAEKVWEITRNRILNGEYDELPKISESNVSHVRPHDSYKRDIDLGPDGNRHPRKCFWLNAKYMEAVIRESGLLDAGKVKGRIIF